MAAQAHIVCNTGRGEIIDLRNVGARDLDPLLRDETLEWRHDLDWDFAPSADLVRRYAGTNSLGGAALLVEGAIAGYAYAVLEEPRALIGDVYVRPEYRTPQAEAELFRSLLDALAATPRISRMESQLMLVGPDSARLIGSYRANDRPIRTFGRHLMMRPRDRAALPQLRIDPRFRMERWQPSYLHASGAIIADAYRDTVDSDINAQYRTPAGARRFLSNIVEYPGCGTFQPAASFLAFDRDTGEAAGMVLASLVAADAGHISQLCVMPGARGRGLGQVLLREAATALSAKGAATVSLTVTASNQSAISLYEKFDFVTTRGFFAYIWEA